MPCFCDLKENGLWPADPMGETCRAQTLQVVLRELGALRGGREDTTVCVKHYGTYTSVSMGRTCDWRDLTWKKKLPHGVDFLGLSESRKEMTLLGL